MQEVDEYRVLCFYRGLQVGDLLMEFVDSREAAEEDDRGWFANHGIDQQLKYLGVQELYPAAFIRRVEVLDDYRRKGLGSTGVNHLLNLAKEHGCKLAYAIVETRSVEQMRVNHHFYTALGWSLFHEEGGEARLPPFERAVFTMGYRSLQEYDIQEICSDYSLEPYQLDP